jgi:ABC-2 type transport system ATP-binding protein
MIQVKNITKRFGTTLAVDGVSFDVPQGQVVGFLGPNGAGKSTTMRVLTGYLPPDDGEAQILGIDLSDSLAIRRRLGYIPENNPLPEDIEVTDYLHFIGQLRGLHNPAERMERVKRVLKLCSLAQGVGKKIGELSKGFRQRVGLAQAIIHDPDILILDEPTSGLDPNQVQEVRALIHDLKKQKTLLISTHILTEVQQTCDRILIINKGKIVGDGTPHDLTGAMQNVNRLFVSLKGPHDAVKSRLGALQGIRSLRGESMNGEDGFIVETDASRDVREEVFRISVEENWPILAMNQNRLSLEDVFRALTQEQTENGHKQAAAGV